MDDLRNGLRGSVYLATDQGYDEKRVGRGSTFVSDRFPSMMIVPENTDDIVRSLDYLQRHKIAFSVRSGGCDVLGASTLPQGAVIDLSRLNRIRLDSTTGIARVGAGVRAGALVTEGAPSGWVPIVGQNPNVGLGGLMLGGGMGWLCGRYGASVDHLLSAEVVTADGQVVVASAEENSDLFWALRGGGGNFGVVTELTLQMQPLRDVVGCVMSYPVEPRAFLRFYRDYLAASPDELELGAAFSVGPNPNVVVRACWTGDPAESDAILRPLRDFAAPTEYSVKHQSYAQFSPVSPVVEGTRLFWRGGEVAGLDDEVIETLASVITRTDMGQSFIGLAHYMHGALCRQPSGETPFIRKSGHICYTVGTMWDDRDDPQEIDKKRAWALASRDSLKTINCSAVYINYLSSEDEADVMAAYGEHYSRLRAIKQRYDPDNIFRNNRNIRP